jgi:predicted dehydrogenase/threonine dehydrogenase-like Zn-dependent dehydrogenase
LKGSEIRQIFLGGDGQPVLLNAPVPRLIANSVLIETTYSLISTGTERAALTKRSGIRGVWEKAVSSRERIDQAIRLVKSQGLKSTATLVRQKITDATPLGNSCSGRVVEVCGRGLPFAVGDRVAAMGTGFANHADWNVVPRNLACRIPDGVSDQDAALGALASIALQGIRRLELSAGENVGVVGLGLIGQLCVRILQALGFRAFGTDIASEKVERANAGGAYTWMSGDDDRMVFRETDGVGLDGVVICASSSDPAVINRAFELCRKRGRVAVVGSVNLDLAREKMYAKELEVRLSCSYGPGRYDAGYETLGMDYPIEHARWTEGRNLQLFLKLLHEKRLSVADLISQSVPIEDFSRAYARVRDGDPKLYGLVLDYGKSPAAEPKTPQSTVQLRGAPPVEGKVRLGLIGAGAYTKNVHVPNIKALSDVFAIEAIASRSGGTAAAIAKNCNPRFVTSDYRALLDDPAIDAVLIATRHAAHGNIILDALDAGKHVYVEKPMTTDMVEADAVCRKVNETGLCLRVGFNRRFSPFCLPFRELVGDPRPAMLSIRVNIGAIGAHWSASAEEGGRFLGEGVHFIDLANWIMAEFPEHVCAVCADREQPLSPNMSLLLRYPSGATAAIVYTSLGHADMGKEYFEVFCDGRSLRCDDFRTLQSFGKMRKLPTVRKGDKGQRRAMEEFAYAVMGRDYPVQGADARAGREATKIALLANNLVVGNAAETAKFVGM